MVVVFAIVVDGVPPGVDGWPSAEPSPAERIAIKTAPPRIATTAAATAIGSHGRPSRDASASGDSRRLLRSGRSSGMKPSSRGRGVLDLRMQRTRHANCMDGIGENRAMSGKRSTTHQVLRTEYQKADGRSSTSDTAPGFPANCQLREGRRPDLLRYIPEIRRSGTLRYPPPPHER